MIAARWPAVAVLSLAAASPVWAAKPKPKDTDRKAPTRAFRVARFAPDAAPKIDGDPSDWAHVPDDYWVTVKDMHRRVKGECTDDLRVAMGYCAETSRLYFLVKVKDNYLKADRKLPPGRDPYFPPYDDVFEVVVDGDTSGGDFIHFKDRARKANRPLRSCHAQNYHVYLIGPPGPEHVWLWGDQHWITRPPYALFAHTMKGKPGGPGEVVLEFMITPFNYAHWAGWLHSAVAPLVPGAKIGIGWLRLDEDGGVPRRFDEGDDYFFGANFWLLRNADYLFEPTLDKEVTRASPK